jgi:septal ring factor EnvC (AmiA/AmiB activator)
MDVQGKDKHNKDILYALADYKQLVLAYKSKQTELVRTVSLWKTSVTWLALVTVCITFAVIFLSSQTKKSLAESRKNISWLNNKIEAISNKLDNTQRELKSTQEELNKKEMLIKELEKNMSTTSKKFLERLLKEQEEEALTK